MADVANVVVSKDMSELANVSSECCDTNPSKDPDKVPNNFQEIDTFSDLSFSTNENDISLQDLIDSEFAARMSGLSAEASPVEETNEGRNQVFDLEDFLKPNPCHPPVNDFDLVNVEEQLESMSLDDFLSSPSGPNTDVVEPDLLAFKCARPNEMPVISSFDPFARIEEDSDPSNSNPASSCNNALNSPDEFPFPESPQEPPVTSSEPMVDLFVKTISEENLDLSDPAQNELDRFNTSSVESVNNSCPNVSDLTSPDRADNEEILSDDLVSSEPVDTVMDQEDGTSSVSHHLSTEETDAGIGDQIPLKHVDLIEDIPEGLELSDENESAQLISLEAKLPESESKSDSEEGNQNLSFNGGSLHEEKTSPIGEILEPAQIISDELDESISEKLPSLCDDLEFARKMAPIAAAEDDEWTTVEEALKVDEEEEESIGDATPVNPDQPIKGDVAINPIVTVTNAPHIQIVTPTEELSETESELSSSSDIRSSKKKKTTTTSSTESNVKRTKKTKKSEEKENISVSEEKLIAMEPQQTESLSLISHSASASNADDLLNVSVREIMQTYCSEAAKSFENKVTEEIIPSPVPIQNLKAHSMVDLSSSNTASKVASLRSNLLHSAHSRSTNNLGCLDRTPVVTGISVRALKERYCSMVNLYDRVPIVVKSEPRRRLSVPSNENLKSSFSKFDQLSKKTVIHVRSVDSTKAQKQFTDATAGNEISNNCKSCGKMVFQMEQIKAERAVWHKNCFRCKECNKQLTLDIYSSHEGVLYCKPHFKELFKPKAVIDDEEPPRFRKPEMIIRESQPIELPPEVVRASDKPDLGLEELATLNVKSRFQVFEKGEESDGQQEKQEPGAISVKRSPSILSKLAKFQKRGIDVGVTDDSLNGAPLDQSASSSEDEEEENSKKVIKNRKLRERPISFGQMEEVKSVWANGTAKTKEELREERKQEIQQIRSRLFMGKQVKMKEAYEQAVRESEASNAPRKSVETIRAENSKFIKECFEKGEPLKRGEEEDETDAAREHKKSLPDDPEVFEAGISKKSRSLFLELDKSASKTQIQAAPKAAPRAIATPIKTREVILQREQSQDIVRASDVVEDVTVNSAEIGSKFKFFETYKEPEKEKKKFRITPPREGQVKLQSPEREVYRDPNVVRASDRVEPDVIRSNTTAKMLSLFRQLEEKTEEIPEGPKPLKCFTPPPDYKEGETTEESEAESEEEMEEEEEENVNPNLVRASDKLEDEYLKQAANAARAKQLRAKFEKWEEKEVQREQQEIQEHRLNGSTTATIPESSDSVEVTSIECTKSLLARFESMRSETDQPKEKLQRPKVNRFVEIQNGCDALCDVCQSKVYPLERIETSGRIFHKSCFRCVQCKCLLRLETFTLNCGRLYCMPHFRQLFTVKGNYDEGFGVDQHKAKWSHVATTC